MRRQGEFPHSVIERKHQLSICEVCGCGHDPKDRFEIHHRIYLEFGIKAGIPMAVLTSYENAMLVHATCHSYIHNEWWDPDPKVVREVLARCGVQHQMRM